MATAVETHNSTPADAAEAVFARLFFTPEGRADPYPLYHQLREMNPVHRDTTLGVWVLSRYDDCWAAMRDPRFGKDDRRTDAAALRSRLAAAPLARRLGALDDQRRRAGAHAAAQAGVEIVYAPHDRSAQAEHRAHGE